MVGDTWQSIDDVKWRYDLKSQASVLTISEVGTVDWENDDDGGKSLTLPGGGFNPPEKRVRSAEQDERIPFYNDEAVYRCNVTTVRLPKATQPAQWSFNKGFDTRLFGRNFYRAFAMRDGAIRMIRGSRVEQREIDAALAKQDNARIASFDNSMARIYYEPSASSTKPSEIVVPATYELDWTANSVPCLSSATIRPRD